MCRVCTHVPCGTGLLASAPPSSSPLRPYKPGSASEPSLLYYVPGFGIARHCKSALFGIARRHCKSALHVACRHCQILDIAHWVPWARLCIVVSEPTHTSVHVGLRWGGGDLVNMLRGFQLSFEVNILIQLSVD